MEKAYDIYVPAEDGSGRMVGVGMIKKGFIDGHLKLATERIEEMRAKGVEIHRVWTDKDGWGDGMKLLWAVIEYDYKLYKIHWNDFNKGFMQKLESGGSVILRIKEVYDG